VTSFTQSRRSGLLNNFITGARLCFGYVGHGFIAAVLALVMISITAPANADQKHVAELETLTVSINRVQLSGTLVSIDLDQTGSLAPPVDPHVAGWYRGGSKPSGVGRTVIVGAVDFKGETGVFWELRQVIVGDLIVIRSKSDLVHSIATFSVTEVTLYRKSDFPTARLYANLAYEGVALVTDGGPNASKTAYLGNLVVYAQLQSRVLLY
jgi:hypothetical protein